MSHDAFRDRLLDLAYGELPPREAREVEAHAASCPACGAELARMRGTRRMMAALPQEPAPEAGERILLAAAREAARARRPARLLPPWVWAVSAAATLLAVGAVSYRILAMRGPAERAETELMGNGSYRAAPAPAAPEAPAPGAPSPSGDGREAGRDERELPMAKRNERKAAPESRAEAPASSGTAPSRKSAPGERTELHRMADGAPPPPLAGFAAPPPAAAREEEEAPPGASSAALEAQRAEAAPDRAAPASAPAPAGAASAPPRASARVRAAAPEPRGQADTQAAPGEEARAPARVDALARYGELRAAGRLRGEIRTFTDCPGEAWRKVETDPDGRVVAYVREGEIGGRRLRVEAIYGADGRLARARVRELSDPSAPLRDARPGEAPGTPEQAAAATADAPPRCGR